MRPVARPRLSRRLCWWPTLLRYVVEQWPRNMYQRHLTYFFILSPLHFTAEPYACAFQTDVHAAGTEPRGHGRVRLVPGQVVVIIQFYFTYYVLRRLFFTDCAFSILILKPILAHRSF